MQSALVGSWHNNGFYGHYRGQFKSESARAYRLAAKPQPPALFLQRCQAYLICHLILQELLPQTKSRVLEAAMLRSLSFESTRLHFFSKHDNRGPFDKGIGKRKAPERLGQPPTFLHWATGEPEFCQRRPLESSYQSNFRVGPGLGDLPQRLVHFVQIEPPLTSTTYKQNFCHPSQGGHCGSDNVAPQSGHCGSDNVAPQAPVTNSRPNLPRIPKPNLLQHDHHGVSACLHWSSALNNNGC